jgi:hypothetical protein
MTTPILTEAPTVRAVLFPAPNTEVGAAVGQCGCAIRDEQDLQRK